MQGYKTISKHMACYGQPRPLVKMRCSINRTFRRIVREIFRERAFAWDYPTRNYRNNEAKSTKVFNGSRQMPRFRVAFRSRLSITAFIRYLEQGLIKATSIMAGSAASTRKRHVHCTLLADYGRSRRIRMIRGRTCPCITFKGKCSFYVMLADL